MKVSPVKTKPGKRLSLLYLLFLSGVGLISLDLFSFPYEVKCTTSVIFQNIKNILIVQDKTDKSIARGTVFLHPCSSSFVEDEVNDAEEVEVFVITPTFPRHEQEAELTRLGQTLMLAGNLTWIVVEDSQVVSSKLRNILNKFSTLNIVLMAGGGKKNSQLAVISFSLTEKLVLSSLF